MVSAIAGVAAMEGDVVKCLEWALNRIRASQFGEGAYFEAAADTLTKARAAGPTVHQQLLANLLTEARSCAQSIPNPLNPVRMRLQAAVDLAELGHVPRRPLADSLQREAEIVGADLDAQSLEQGEPA